MQELQRRIRPAVERFNVPHDLRYTQKAFTQADLYLL
jgi:hypothetical protein